MLNLFVLQFVQCSTYPVFTGTCFLFILGLIYSHSNLRSITLCVSYAPEVDCIVGGSCVRLVTCYGSVVCCLGGNWIAVCGGMEISVMRAQCSSESVNG